MKQARVSAISWQVVASMTEASQTISSHRSVGTKEYIYREKCAPFERIHIAPLWGVIFGTKVFFFYQWCFLLLSQCVSSHHYSCTFFVQQPVVKKNTPCQGVVFGYKKFPLPNGVHLTLAIFIKFKHTISCVLD